MALPGNAPLSVERGADETWTFIKKADGVPVDFTGLKARAQFRDLEFADGNSTTTSLLLELLDGAGVAITDPDGGEVTLSLTGAQSQAMCPDNFRTKVFDQIELYDDAGVPDIITPFLKGKLTITPEGIRG
jgi:hypothetical protein